MFRGRSDKDNCIARLHMANAVTYANIIDVKAGACGLDGIGNAVLSQRLIGLKDKGLGSVAWATVVIWVGSGLVTVSPKGTESRPKNSILATG